MCNSACIIPMMQFDEKIFTRLMRKNNVVGFGGIPLMFQKLMKDKHFDGPHLANVRLMFCGGDDISDGFIDEYNSYFEKWGATGRLRQGYGLTECAPLAAVNPDRAPKDRSAGVVLPGGELKIINADEDGVGEICYRGDNVMLGYYKMPEVTAEVKRNGWLHTGDLGYIDEDGYLIITGRKKNIIVTANGKNIFPEELETYMLRSPYVAECVVVGYMNEKKKDYDIVALVYPDHAYAKEALGSEATDEKIYEQLVLAAEEVNSTVQSYKRIGMVIQRSEEFPKNSSRKIKRMGVADLAREEYLAMRG